MEEVELDKATPLIHLNELGQKAAKHPSPDKSHEAREAFAAINSAPVRERSDLKKSYSNGLEDGGYDCDCARGPVCCGACESSGGYLSMPKICVPCLDLLYYALHAVEEASIFT